MKGAATILLATVVAISIVASLRSELFLFVYSFPGGDKTGHFLLMGALSFSVVLGFSGLRLRGRAIGPLLCTGAVLLLVALEEVTQAFLPNRQVSLFDLLASYAGVILFALVASLVWRRKNKAIEE